MSKSDSPNENMQDLIEKLANGENEKNIYTRVASRQIRRNNKGNIADNPDELVRHKSDIYTLLEDEMEFKKNARFVSIIILAALTMLILGNLGLVLYWNPKELGTAVIVSLITASFANIFAIVLFVFKYIFSPTKDIMEYNAKLNNNGNDE